MAEMCCKRHTASSFFFSTTPVTYPGPLVVGELVPRLRYTLKRSAIFYLKSTLFKSTSTGIGSSEICFSSVQLFLLE